MENEITRSIELNAPLETCLGTQLHNPISSPSGSKCTIDGVFEVGNVVNCGSTYEGNEAFQWQKLIRAVDPKSYFAFSWSPGETGADLYSQNAGETLVEFRLTSTDTGTRLVITESGFENLPAAAREQSFRMNSDGWDAQAKNIENYVHARS